MTRHVIYGVSLVDKFYALGVSSNINIKSYQEDTNNKNEFYLDHYILSFHKEVRF